LSTRSDDFRKLWAAHDVRIHETGNKRIHHPIVGDLDLTYEAMDVTSTRGLQLIAFTAQPGTPSNDGLQLLANWAMTSDEAIASLPGSPPGADARGAS
jgi:hypothetical protein